MQIEVKELEPCKLEIDYTADIDKILNKEKEVIEMFKNVSVSGYRKGKAPVSVVKLKYKNQIQESLKRALVEEAYNDTVFEKNLNVLGEPSVLNATLFNNTFTCKLGIFVRPSFDLKPFEYEIPEPEYKKTAEDVAASKLEELRRSYGDVRQYTENDVVEVGDNVILNYTTYVNDAVFPDLTTEGDLLTVGASSLPEFDSNIVGMKLNEVKEFVIRMPESSMPSLSNQDAKFQVTLVGASKVIPNPLDDSLALKLGKENFNELHLAVSGLANSTIDLEKKQLLVDSLTRVLVNDYTFEVPEWMAIPDAKVDAQNHKIDFDSTSDEIKNVFISKAKDTVKLSLILDKIRSEEPEAQLSDKEIYEAVKNTLLHYSQGRINESNVDEEMKKVISTGEFRMIAVKLLDEHAIDFILNKIKVIQ